MNDFYKRTNYETFCKTFLNILLSFPRSFFRLIYGQEIRHRAKNVRNSVLSAMRVLHFYRAYRFAENLENDVDPRRRGK